MERDFDPSQPQRDRVRAAYDRRAKLATRINMTDSAAVVACRYIFVEVIIGADIGKAGYADDGRPIAVTGAARALVRPTDGYARRHESIKASKRGRDKETQTAIVSTRHGGSVVPTGRSSPRGARIVILGLCWKSGFSMLFVELEVKGCALLARQIFLPIREGLLDVPSAAVQSPPELSVDASWNRIGTLLTEFTPNECVNFFAAAAYEPLRKVTALAVANHAHAKLLPHHRFRPLV